MIRRGSWPWRPGLSAGVRCAPNMRSPVFGMAVLAQRPPAASVVCWWSGAVAHVDGPEPGRGVLAVQAERAGQVRLLGVGEPGEQVPVGADRDRGPGLGDLH